MLSEVDDIFNELIRKIGASSGPIAGFCGSIYNTGDDGLCKNRCQEITKILLYMKGYDLTQTQALQTRTVHQADWTAFQEYLRCVLAGEALVRVYGSTRDHVDVMNKVKDELTPGKTFMQHTLESGICENRDWGKVIFQSHRMGTALQNRLEPLRKRLTPARGSAGQAPRKCGWDNAEGTDEDGDPTSDAKCNQNDVVIPPDDPLMTHIKDWVDTAGTFPQLKKVLDDMHKEGASKKKCEIEQKIRKGVEAVKDRVNPRKPATAAKPAAAKPAPVDHGSPAKPVAATPGPSVTPGATSSAAAGGQAGKGAAAGENGTKANVVECDADRARQHKARTVYVVPLPNKDEWNKWKQVLEDFKEYMDKKKEHANDYGANCDNAGWDDIRAPTEYYMGQKVADVVRCRVMSVAWGFANGWGPDNTIGRSGNTEEQERQNMRKCEVANIFGHLLQTKYCPTQQNWTRGVEYSRIAFQNMHSTGTTEASVMNGPVTAGKCTACGYQGYERWSRAINWNVVEWLLQEGKILEGLDKIEDGADCNMKWKEYKKYKLKHDGTGSVDEDKITDIKNAAKKIVEEAMKTIEKVTKVVEQKIQDIADTKPAAPSRASPGPIEGGSEKAGKDKSKPTCPAAGGSHTRHVGGGTLTVSVSFVPSSDPKDCSGSNSPKIPECTTPVESENNADDATIPGPPQQPQDASQTPPSASQPASAGTIDPSTTSAPGKPSSDTTTSSTGTGPDGTKTDKNDGDPAGTAVVDGGQEDPPPLNPPKPKPDPNPDQAGSSGSGDPSEAGSSGPASTGHGAGNTGGADDKTHKTADDPFGLDPNNPGTAVLGTVGGAFVEGIPPLVYHDTKGKGPDKNPDNTVPPIFTAKDIFLSTPVLIFFAFVTSLILLFFLGKYFAYLGKQRRRKFRTVRDVPSPPLDDEILEHLQRGAPPPDYGYTMIRDRRPGRLPAARRRRPPRVHKRTIIELHLEVHNECAAPEWENVKEHYLEILVEEFMGGHNGHSSSPDAPTTNQASSGHNPWFLQLKADWTQYLREHIAANEDHDVSGNSELGERGNIPSAELKKHAWKQWVEQQHRHMSTYTEEEWFQHLLNNVEEETVPQHGHAPAVEKDLEVEKVTAAQQRLRLRDLPRSQLHPQSYMKKPLNAKIWILILALVIEQCELESRLKEKELYVDDLLQTL
ncbi:hypothetical protein AK88_05355 [Plasmodium fragile]|uniref:Schizont-infected cell agglutination C-terminal domain-containing protein n=1 Tax=Plasmodium fragile TaxID=5857 RepID=A0A0D9QDC0_PLAFR|nr:uncharacterized protein AK88_05355 [Plasmodium fragile]KJP85013.1 hypothetical protein AK88_05355 [Plasmodium fragile]